jgi:hypothetical protein
MDQDRKKRLIELGPDILADALLNLAIQIDAADELVERLIATPQENIQRYMSKLARLKRGRRFISWNESASYANELEMLLGDLKSGVEDPRTGVELVAIFYQADQAVLEQCDDSSGIVGNVFRFEANQLFVSYASKCQDKKWLSKLVFRLTSEDEYGVRDILVDSASEYLSELAIRELIERFQKTADKEGVDYKKRHCLRQIESLARQIKDAPLFERTRLDSWGKLNAAACLDIAQVYLESGDAETALSWIRRIPNEETSFREHERDKLLLDIYAKKSDTNEMAKVAWRIFKRYRSIDTLNELLSVIQSATK